MNSRRRGNRQQELLPTERYEFLQVSGNPTLPVKLVIVISTKITEGIVTFQDMKDGYQDRVCNGNNGLFLPR